MKFEDFRPEDHNIGLALVYGVGRSGAVLRLLTIATTVFGYVALRNPAYEVPWLAALVAGLAFAYAAIMGLANPYGHFPVGVVARCASVTECLLTTIFLAATGGARSPVYLIWYVAIIAMAARFEHTTTLKFAGLYVVAYLAMTAAMGQLPEFAITMAVRSLFILLAGGTAAELSRIAFTAAAARVQWETEAESLRKLNDMTSYFITTASHELRTPLTAIRAFSEMLADDPTIEETDRRDFARIINLESERLARLADSLLDLHRIDSGALVPRLGPLDLNLLIEAIRSQQEPVAAAKGLVLAANVPDGLPLVSADADAVHQVLLNLITNAIKFTATGEVTISAERSGDRVLISVTDTGRGILPSEQERIFEPFYQSESIAVDKPAGAGLGLAICRQLLALHKSKLNLRSQLGEGSTFTFDLEALPT